MDLMFFNLNLNLFLAVVFQGKKGESGLPGVDGLPGPPVSTLFSFITGKIYTHFI